jgi:hypothetical protein
LSLAVGLTHQALLLWAARRMQADGYVVAGFDGTAPQGGNWNLLHAPFKLGRHRPDAWGATPDGALVAFAEAKTAADILNRHTLEQLRIFGAVRMKTGSKLCALYVAVPREQAVKLDVALNRAGLLSAAHVIRMHVPEALLREGRHAA